VDLTAFEQVLRLCLKEYVGQLPADRQQQIFELKDSLYVK
jgi:hypothetical protein